LRKGIRRRDLDPRTEHSEGKPLLNGSPSQAIAWNNKKRFGKLVSHFGFREKQ